MKISCQSCQAKYTIADEKVLGKVVKIRCKKCGSTIVINGNEAAPKEDSETAVFDYTSQSANEQWTVNVADGDQRTLTVADIVREYRAGVINDETYCWKDGMSDWLPVRDIEQFQQALASGGEMRPSLTFEESGAGGFSPASVRPGSVRPAPEDQFAPSSRNGNGGLFGESAAAAAPAAARRVGGRGGGGADLFGGVAHAGGEEDVMTSAPTAAAAAAAAADASRDDKLTGQRNENSVLFSLAALTDDKGPGNGKGPGPSDNKTSAQGDGSGLIDIRALSANMGGGGDGGEKNRVDDIMNLSGGGAFGAALAAPILAPPPMEVSAMDQGGGQSKGSNKGLMLGLLGGGAFLAIALVAVAIIVVGAKKTDGGATATGGPGSATPNTTASTGSGGALAAADPTGTSTGIAPSTTDTAAPPSVGTAGGKGATAAAGTAKAPGTSTAGALVAKNDPPPAPGPAAPEPKPTAKAGPASLAEAMATAAGTKPAPAETAAASGGGAFDRGAAAAAIGAVNVASCKKPDGPTGSGHAFITFGPDGSVKTVEVDGGPYPGTPVGGCIAGKFRSARVPAFSGSPVRVGKSFSIN